MNISFAMFNGWEIVLILALALILFGAKRLPELARGLGQGIREFKKSTREVTDELESALDTDTPPPPARSNQQRKIQTPPEPAENETVEHKPVEEAEHHTSSKSQG